MIKTRTVFLAALLAVCSFGTTSPLFADALTPGTVGAPDNFGAITGLAYIASTSTPFSGEGISGTFTQAVYSNGSGDLDFLFQADNTSTSERFLVEATFSSYTGFTTDVGYITNGASLASSPFVDGTGTPDEVALDSAGSVVSFILEPSGSDIGPGVTTDVLVIETNATNYDANGTGHLIFAGGDPGNGTYEPIAAVASPEPGSGVLLACGFLGLLSMLSIGAVRRKQLA